MSVNASSKVFIILSGNTFGVEAAQAIAGALKKKNTIKIVNASDIFTSRLREEIPSAVKAICDALEDKEQLEELNFSDNAFGPAGAEPMVDFLTKNRRLRVLKLNNNGLGVRGGILIGKALLAAADKNVSEGRTSSLRTIIAGRNRLEDGSSQALANAIAAHGTLTEVRIPQNGIRPDGIITLSKGLAVCKDLEILDLQDNTFTEKGSVNFAKALVEWPNLKVLNVGDCLLSTKGGITFAEALSLGHNKKLEKLNLQYNELDREAVEILATTISNHLKNLNSLELNGNKVNPKDISIRNVISALEENGNADALGELDDMEISDEEEEEELDEEETEPSVKGLEDRKVLIESKVESRIEIQTPEKHLIEVKSVQESETREIHKDQETPSANSERQVKELTERISKDKVTESSINAEQKVVKPLTPAKLEEFKKAQDNTGIIYLSCVPPFMKPSKIKHLLGQYGNIGRVYLAPEDPKARSRRKKYGGNKKKKYTEGWVEFLDKKVAKLIAKTLNAQPIGGNKRNYYHDDLWNIKYLAKFKWNNLTEQIAYEKAARTQRLQAEISQARRENKEYVKKVEKAKMIQSMEEKKEKKRKAAEVEMANLETFTEADVGGHRKEEKG
ncbi:345_t:CDS:2 [Funneliformis caledonium]|uniref:18S rRNA factor 2 n=1 Tax=Funneliformis caledonium TaxID=1117310 RepID=A0A9N9B7G7_9GLOM|nr:345_t:CDS:2 [Funneliformis caledonium]